LTNFIEFSKHPRMIKKKKKSITKCQISEDFILDTHQHENFNSIVLNLLAMVKEYNDKLNPPPKVF